MRTLAVAAVLSCVLLPASAEEVLTLTSSTFDGALKEHPFLVVEFFAPWCGHCKQLAPEWEKAAVALKGDTSAGVPITLAAVDATVDRDLGEKFDVQGFPTIKIFEQGADKPSEYEGPRKADGIVSYLKKRAGPASKEVTSADEAKALLESEKVIIVLAGAETESWKKVSSAMRDAAKWVHSTDKKVWSAFGVKSGSISALRQFDEKLVSFSGKDSDVEKVKEFVMEARRPVAMPVAKGDQDALKLLFQDDSLPNLFLFSADGKDALSDFKAAAKSVHSTYMSAVFSASDFPEAFEHFGVKPSDAPRVLIEDRKAQLRFLMDGAVSKAAVEKFVADHQAGNLEPFLKSEPEPADNTAPVKVVVADSFQKWTTGGKWLFLEAYAPWCGHCKNLAPVWEDLGKAFAGESDKLVIAKVDATANDLPKSLGVQGFPTLMLFKGDGSPPERYAQGERDYAALSKWLTDKTGAKPAADFVPTSPKAPSKGAAAGKGLAQQIILFLSTDFQMPIFAQHTISGLWIAATILFLLFVAAIALVIAFVSRDPIPPTKSEKKD